MWIIIFRANKLILRGYMGFETLKYRFFFIIFYIIIQPIKNSFPKFQVNRSKILRKKRLLNPVGGHDFSKTNAPILLKLCTLLLDKIDSWLNSGFLFFDYNLFYKPIHGLTFTENRTVYIQLCQKIRISNFFKIIRSITSYTHLLTKNIRFFDFRKPALNGLIFNTFRWKLYVILLKFCSLICQKFEWINSFSM